MALVVPFDPSPMPRVLSVGGVLPVRNLQATLEAQQINQAAAGDTQSSPLVGALAAHIREAWRSAVEAKKEVEDELVAALMARRGEYDAAKLAQIQQQGQPPIYMMIAATKMRHVEALLRDVLIGTGVEKPWTIRPTPVPDLPVAAQQAIVKQLYAEILSAMATGFQPTIEQAKQRLEQIMDELRPRLLEEAAKRAEKMEAKMEDQLLEGGFLAALDEFITDIATYKTAFIAGPLVRKKPQLRWSDTGQMVVEDKLVLEWERVSPFDMYPAPGARSLDDGPLIRKHRLTRQTLMEMIGVEGFDESAIRKVIEEFGSEGLQTWTKDQPADGEQDSDEVRESGTIDALQYWGSASGEMLIEWGLPEAQVPDRQKEYQVEAWLIDKYVIKAMLNADPLARRPFYASSFQRVPGSVWGNSPYDLMRDCQDMCNAAARALAANLGISSGPQVAVYTNRLADGEEITQMFPWKIWQFKEDPLNGSARPIDFFQPQSNAAELMSVYERFSVLADEYTGIPRYMAGFNGGEGGAGRTASGISLMIGNASKVIKQVVGNIDTSVLQPLLERLYYYNMRYGEDEDLKGDVKILARGAMSLVAKETAQVRTNEFLQIALASPAVQEIIGVEGLAELLRPALKRLDLNPDKIVPPAPVLKQRMLEVLAAQAMAQSTQQTAASAGQSAQPAQSAAASVGGERLMDDTPVTDLYSPKPKRPAGVGRSPTPQP